MQPITASQNVNTGCTKQLYVTYWLVVRKHRFAFTHWRVRQRFIKKTPDHQPAPVQSSNSANNKKKSTPQMSFTPILVVPTQCLIWLVYSPLHMCTLNMHVKFRTLPPVALIKWRFVFTNGGRELSMKVAVGQDCFGIRSTSWCTAHQDWHGSTSLYNVSGRGTDLHWGIFLLLFLFLKKGLFQWCEYTVFIYNFLFLCEWVTSYAR